MHVRMRSRVPKDKVAEWKGHHPEKDHYDLVVTGNIDLYGPGNKPVIIVRRGGLSQERVDEARPVLHAMKSLTTDNRGNYAGGKRVLKVKQDGTMSKVSRAKPVRSAMAGYIEKQGGRFPFCREAAYNQHNPLGWAVIQPVLRDVATLYRDTMPEKYAAQMKHVNATHPAWVIDGTPFTTITVNNTVPAAYHQDAGDLRDGFGVMFVLRDGDYRGYELVIPEYRVAVDLHDGDVIFFDPTVWHGNVPPYDTEGEELVDYNRISVVCYYREGIKGCLSPEAELEKAKARGAL